MNSSSSEARLAAVWRSRPYMRPAKLRNSAPVRRPKSAIPSGTTPICRFTSTGYASRSRPRMSIFPELGASKPVSILIVVDLPAPLGPRKPKNCPGATRRLTSSTATRSPKRRVNPSVEMVGLVLIEIADPGKSESSTTRVVSAGVLANVWSSLSGGSREDPTQRKNLDHGGHRGPQLSLCAPCGYLLLEQSATRKVCWLLLFRVGLLGLLTFHVFSPRWYHADHSCVGDRLAKMFSRVPHDE